MPFLAPNDGGLKSIFKVRIPEFDWQPIERSSATGLPDMNYCGDGIEGWIENKLAKTNRLQHPPTPQQIAWAERRIRNGGRVLCAVRKKNVSQRNRCDDLYLFHGNGMRYLTGTFGGIDNVPTKFLLHRSAGNSPAGWDWAGIREILISKATFC